MKILVTGGSGLLGKYLHLTEPAEHDVDYTWYSTDQPWCQHRLNVCVPKGDRTSERSQRQIDYLFGKVKPEIVIHMAGIGNVDFCEKNYQLARDTNVEGTRHLMRVAGEYGAHVWLTSTNAVFAGTDPLYNEYDEREPVNAYGKIRKVAEDVVLKDGGSVVRLFLLYGWEPEGARGNWASGTVRALRDGHKLKMVNDRWYMPTYAPDAARALWALLDQGQGNRGVYHVAGQDRVTLYEFCRTVAETWDLDPSLVEPCSFDDLPGLAPRPVDSSYDTRDVEALGITCRGVKEGLEAMWHELHGTSVFQSCAREMHGQWLISTFRGGDDYA